jgi:glycine cleavage system H protein
MKDAFIYTRTEAIEKREDYLIAALRLRKNDTILTSQEGECSGTMSEVYNFSFDKNGEKTNAKLLANLYYHKDHTYAKVEGKNVKVGLDDFGQSIAGKILFVRLRPEGKSVNQGESIGKLESGKWVGDLKTPVSGTIIQVNSKIKGTPSLVNTDPYGEGWLLVIQPSKLDAELKTLTTGPAIKKWMEKEIVERLKK